MAPTLSPVTEDCSMRRCITLCLTRRAASLWVEWNGTYRVTPLWGHGRGHGLRRFLIQVGRYYQHSTIVAVARDTCSER